MERALAPLTSKGASERAEVQVSGAKRAIHSCSLHCSWSIVYVCELALHISEDCIDCVSGRSLPESSTAEMAVVGRRRPYTIPRSSINH
jgi:hypothetical protein